MSAAGDFLREVGTFVSDPGPGVVIAFTWVFGPLITFAGVQRIKRLAKASGYTMSPLCIEGMAAFASFAISALIMIGLYSVELRPAFIHSILIAWVYTVSVSWWMGWAKQHRPDLYQALRTERRAMDDTQEIKAEEMKP